MPIPRAEGASFVADGKFYCFGGFDNATTLTISNEMDAYDPTTNTWTRVADCPVKVNDNPVTVDPVTDTAWCGGFFLNDGFHASGLMYSYDVKADKWTQQPSLPKNVGSGQMGVVGRELYYFGGRDSNNIGTTAMWKLNLDNPSAGWTADTPMLFTANHDGAVNLNNKIYAIGGIVDKQENTSNQNHVQVFDPGTDQWTLAAPLPVGLGHIASAVTVASGDILVCGGQIDGSGQILTKGVYQYDPVANSWSQLSNLPDYRVSDFVGYVGGKLLVTGGNQYSSPYIATVLWSADYGTQTVTLPTVSIGDAAAQQGSDVQFTATLSSPTATPVTASYTLIPGTASIADFDSAGGTVTFTAGSTKATIDVPTLSDSSGMNEQFTLTLSGLSAAATFANGQTTESAIGTITHAAEVPAPSTTVVASSSNSITLGDSVTLTATVADDANTPTGAVTFIDNGNTIGTADLDTTGSASFSTAALNLGGNDITARYAGNGTVAASTSEVIGVYVALNTHISDTTITTLSVAANLLTAGQSNVFTVAVGVTPPLAGPGITGSVSIFNGATLLGTYPLDSTARAVVTLPAASLENDASYTAVYSGDANYLTSTSNAVLQTVLPPSTAVPAIHNATVPTTAIAGQPILARLPITLENSGAMEKGKFTLQLYADTAGQGLSDTAVLLSSTTRRMTLKPGKAVNLPLRVKRLPRSLPTGTYHLVFRLTDTMLNSSIITSLQTITVQAPAITLSAVLADATPSTLKPGQTGSMVLSITNSGNISARGVLSLQITAVDINGNPVTGIVLARQKRAAVIRAGFTVNYRVRIKANKTAAAGAIYPFAVVTLGEISATARSQGTLTIT